MYAIIWESKYANEQEWQDNKIICNTVDEMRMRTQQIWNYNPREYDIRHFHVVEINDQKNATSYSYGDFCIVVYGCLYYWIIDIICPYRWLG